MTRMTTSPDTIARTLIADFQAQTPPRVWSLIVTFFGDAILPRGGTVALSTISDLLAIMDIGGSAIRPALSRLARDGLFDREKQGRNSFYRLSDEAARDFRIAAERIYAERHVAWDGAWRIVVLPDTSNGREGVRARLLAAGFGQIAPNVLVATHISIARAQSLLDELGIGDDAALFSAELANSDFAASALFESAWPETGARRGYERFLHQFQPLLDPLASRSDAPTPETAMILRLLLIHQFRRAALIDPVVPDMLRPADWPGKPARALASRLYTLLVPASERWLDANGATPGGKLPAPRQPLEARFRTD